MVPSASLEYPVTEEGIDGKQPLMLKVGFSPAFVTTTPEAPLVGHFPASHAETVIVSQTFPVRFNPLIVQVAAFTAFVLFRNTPFAYTLTTVPVDEAQVPVTEVVPVVITDVVIVGAVEFPPVEY